MSIPPIGTQRALIPTCDLKNIDPSKPHNITKIGLITDPLNRKKIDGEGRYNEVMKLCSSCYLAARAEKQREEGLTWDLKIISHGLRI